MKHDSYNEQRERGNFSFPVEYHYVTNHHPRYNMPYHWHIQYEIIRVLEGKIVISIDENEYTASAGDIIFITDGCAGPGAARRPRRTSSPGCPTRCRSTPPGRRAFRRGCRRPGGGVPDW